MVRMYIPQVLGLVLISLVRASPCAAVENERPSSGNSKLWLQSSLNSARRRLLFSVKSEGRSLLESEQQIRERHDLMRLNLDSTARRDRPAPSNLVLTRKEWADALSRRMEVLTRNGFHDDAETLSRAVNDYRRVTAWLETALSRSPQRYRGVEGLSSDPGGELPSLKGTYYGVLSKAVRADLPSAEGILDYERSKKELLASLFDSQGRPVGKSLRALTSASKKIAATIAGDHRVESDPFGAEQQDSLHIGATKVQEARHVADLENARWWGTVLDRPWIMDADWLIASLSDLNFSKVETTELRKQLRAIDRVLSDQDPLGTSDELASRHATLRGLKQRILEVQVERTHSTVDWSMLSSASTVF